MNILNENDYKDKSVIPNGLYCYSYDPYGKLKVCPYWSKRKDLPKQSNGCCSFLGVTDEDLPLGLLWDCCKECDTNM